MKETGSLFFNLPVAFIIKGNLHKKGNIISKIREHFEEIPVEILETEFSGHAILLTKEALLAGGRIIIAVGGDGTLNEVVNGMLEGMVHLSEEEQRKVRLGLLPHGTGNDFARTIKATRDLAVLKNWIIHDNSQTVWPAKVHYQMESGITASRYFINVADVGLGAAVVDRMRRSRWLGALLTYQLAILKTFFHFRNPQVTMQAKEMSYAGEMMTLVIAKGKYFGNALGIAPHASPHNPELACVLLGKVTILNYLLHLHRVIRLKSIHHKAVSYFHSSRVSLSHINTPIPLETDGEFIGYTPVVFEQGKLGYSFIPINLLTILHIF